MLKNIVKILSIGLVICALFNGTLCFGYKATKVTYTISGTTGLNGVVMKGLPGNPVTDDKGNYSVTVEYGWSGTVTPAKEGYNFEPASRKYESVAAEQPVQNYTALLINYQISGSVGISGVVMSGLPGEPVTDKDGNYNALIGHGWGGTVTPTKEGYVFKPANRSYEKITQPQSNQNYTASLLSFAISGTVTIGGVPMEGVSVSASNGGGSATTNEKGQYTISVNYGWSGEVTPKREGYTFDLPTRKYTEIITSINNQNYTAEILTCTISGTITIGDSPLNGVVMYGLPGDPFTNENGYYSSTVNYGWSSVVTPTKPGYNFTPVNKTYEPLTTHQTQNYTAKLLTYTVSGSVGIGDVVMAGLPGDPISDANGRYSVTVDYGWSGTVTPTKEGYRFNPANRIYESVTENQERNHTPELMSFIISGKVASDVPISGVVMKGLPGEPITNEEGHYSAIVNYGWEGSVTPVKEGCVFEPAKKLYSKVTEDQPQNYQAQILTYTIAGVVACDRKPVEDVSINASNAGGSAKTNANGQYELLVKHGWSGTITPVMAGYTFEAPKQEYRKVIEDINNQNYNATLIRCTISGKIILDGVPTEGVLVSADNGGSSDMTNAKGEYRVTVDYGWTGTVAPTKAGYMFSPPSKRYINVTSNIVEKEEEPPKPPEPPQQQETTEQQKKDEVITKEQKPLPEETPEKAPEKTKPVTKPETVTEPAAKPAVEPPVIEKPQPEQPEAKENVQTNLVTETPTEPQKQQEETAEVPKKPAPKQPLISNVFVDTELRQVLQDLASQAGIIIIPDQTVTGLITCELKEMPLDKALEIVLAGTGYVLKKTPDYYLISSPNPKDAAFPVSSQTKIIKLNYLKAEAAVKLLSPVFANYVQAYADTGTVCITAPLALVERIEADIKEIDKAPSHIMLDAKVVVMQNSNLLDLGIEWGWPQIKAGTFSNSYLHGGGAPLTGSKWPWGIQIGYAPGQAFTNALELTLNLLEKNGEATIVSSPQVLAQDGKMAEIKITTEEYYSLMPKYIEGTPYYYNPAQLEKIEYGTILNMTPHIGENGDITLDLAIEVSDIVMRSTDNYPVISRRTVKNTMRIKDGGTVTVAGLKKNEAYLTKQNVPGIGHVPVLGGLFSSKNNQEASQQVAIFVTAHLIPNPEVRSRLSELPTEERKPIEPVGNEFKQKLEEQLNK
jgi:type II secretory pathway component GspD/PulD (secretin)